MLDCRFLNSAVVPLGTRDERLCLPGDPAQKRKRTKQQIGSRNAASLPSETSSSKTEGDICLYNITTLCVYHETGCQQNDLNRCGCNLSR